LENKANPTHLQNVGGDEDANHGDHVVILVVDKNTAESFRVVEIPRQLDFVQLIPAREPE
jgi:hypothetical protein